MLIEEMQNDLIKKDAEIMSLKKRIYKIESIDEDMKNFKTRYSEEQISKMSQFEYHNYDRYVAVVDYHTTDRSEILLGYSAAVFDLIKQVISGKATEDELIYPIMFCARHGIEIGLKIYCDQINQILKVKNINALLSVGTHNLENIILKMCETIKMDKRIEEKFAKIIPYIQDYYFDDEEVVFRYKINKGGKDLLEKNKIKRISIDILCCKFYYLQQRLIEFYYLLEELIEEYYLKSFTGTLSRNQIKELSMELHGFDDLEKEDKKKKISLLQTEFNTTCTQINQAISIIRNHYEFSAYMGNEKLIGKISDDEIEAYIELVYRLGDKIKTETTHRKAGDCDFNILKEKMQISNKLIHEFSERISENTIIYFRIFREFGRGEIKYVEYLDSKFDELQKQSIGNEYFINDLLRKLSNYSECGYILKGMNRCGQHTYVKRFEINMKNFGIKDIEILPDLIDIGELFE